MCFADSDYNQFHLVSYADSIFFFIYEVNSVDPAGVEPADSS